MSVRAWKMRRFPFLIINHALEAWKFLHWNAKRFFCSFYFFLDEDAVDSSRPDRSGIPTKIGTERDWTLKERMPILGKHGRLIEFQSMQTNCVSIKAVTGANTQSPTSSCKISIRERGAHSYGRACEASSDIQSTSPHNSFLFSLKSLLTK